jgi:hypothetical protein
MSLLAAIAVSRVALWRFLSQMNFFLCLANCGSWRRTIRRARRRHEDIRAKILWLSEDTDIIGVSGFDIRGDLKARGFEPRVTCPLIFSTCPLGVKLHLVSRGAIALHFEKL